MTENEYKQCIAEALCPEYNALLQTKKKAILLNGQHRRETSGSNNTCVLHRFVYNCYEC